MSTFDEWVDSLPITLADRPHVVYIAWGDDLPLYVGMTSDLERRIRGHWSSITSAWTSDCTHVEFVETVNRAAAERLERQVILDLRPVGNRWKPSPFVELTDAEFAVQDRDAAFLMGELFAKRGREAGAA